MTHDIEQLADRALDAFWDVVTNRFPAAQSGDLSPDRAVHLSLAAEDAITEWITVNASVDRRALKSSALHELLTLARTCRQAFGERLETLREERADMQRYTDDLDDIDDQIGHYEALQRQCDAVIKNVSGRRVRKAN